MDKTTVVAGARLTARRNPDDKQIHWYRTWDLDGSSAGSPFWAGPWCRTEVPYAVRDWKPALSSTLTGPACPACNQASPIY